MKNIYIARSSGPKITRIEMRGPAAAITVIVEAQMNARLRRTIGLAFFRQIRPYIDYFTQGQVRHLDDSSLDFWRMEERGVKLFKAKGIGTPQGRLGYEIRMKRLKTGWSQEKLSQLAQIERRHLSRIERGLCTPRRSTLERLEAALQK